MCTLQAIGPDRWYHSGDLATMDATGHVRIVGRLKDLVVRGGSNVYPAELEQVLLLLRDYRDCALLFHSFYPNIASQVLHQHPAVQDAQVVGVPDERLGEEVCACVRLKEIVREFDKEELIEFCKVLNSLASRALLSFHYGVHESLNSLCRK